MGRDTLLREAPATAERLRKTNWGSRRVSTIDAISKCNYHQHINPLTLSLALPRQLRLPPHPPPPFQQSLSTSLSLVLPVESILNRLHLESHVSGVDKGKNGLEGWRPRLCSGDFFVGDSQSFQDLSCARLRIFYSYLWPTAGMKNAFLFTSIWALADGELCTQALHCVL